VSWRGARTHVAGNTRTSPNPGRAAPGLDEECRHLELILAMTERASPEVSLPPFKSQEIPSTTLKSHSPTLSILTAKPAITSIIPRVIANKRGILEAGIWP
jgi:hypothetical protein